MVDFQHILAVSALLFGIGVFGALSRRNILAILMSLELIFNAAALNLVTLDRMVGPGRWEGQVFTVFIVTIAAAEAVVGLALLIGVYRHTNSPLAERMNLLKG